MIEHVVQPIVPAIFDEKRLDERDFVLVNPTGRFVVGGPMGDTGLTGRKIIVDTYGGSARHGGGAFSGKDPTKVDRSAAYAARYVAKNIVAAGPGRSAARSSSPTRSASPSRSRSWSIPSAPRRSRREDRGARARALRPAPGRHHRDLDLRRPIYRKTAAYGHFGRDDHDFTWERTDKAEALRKAAGL